MKLAGGKPELIAEVRNTMERQTEQMVRLIDDLLDVSRITRGKLRIRMEQVALADVLKVAVDAVRPLIDAAGHQFVVTLPDEPLTLDADPSRLAQVVSNLLNNAAKYTPPGGCIRLTAERQDAQAVISVRDSGIGIPAPMLDRIFDMFTQVDRKDRGDTGLGIGLTLVRSLVEMHGGDVHVRSGGMDQGSEFTIRVPIRDPQPAAEKIAGQRPPQVHRGAWRRVLAVDDNQAALQTLKLLIEMHGSEVCTAQDGVEAVQAAESFRPDAVFMDLGMPRMDGFEAARLIRKQPWGRDVLLVAVTGWGQDEDRRRTKEAGFDHHLVKPVAPGVLQELLTRPA
jgi:CheY-like chemotaxis protein/two-component sensor histidine kinase